MSDLLFELGCEEIPAFSVERAYHQLRDEITARLTEARLTYGATQGLGTPRRLIVSISEIADRQEDSSEEVRGPSLKSAFDASENPTPALLGFCRGQGVDPATVRKEGDYVWITKQVAGKSTRELLATILPESVKALSWDKSMRWGSSRMRFVRPIRWMLALLGEQTVEFEIEGVASSNTSVGHRFNHPEPFVATGFNHLVSELRSRDVEPDAAVRRERILSGAKAVAGGFIEFDENLVYENTFLTEWPEAHRGEFKPEYMVLPDSVLITAMAKHERFFPIRESAEGPLSNRFVSIRNGGVEDVVRSGNEWVLSARFNDAKFFFDEDKKVTLDQFLAKTEKMMFQERLGSVRQRADRLAKLVPMLTSLEGADRAGLYAKADLSTGLVSELASLQGVIGAEYARREGFAEPIALAIASHYDLTKAKRSELGLALLLADQIDKLAGYLGVGLVPTGSSDPYGLRRAVSLCIESEYDGIINQMVSQAQELYREQGFEVADAGAALDEIFRGRYKALFDEVRYDVLDAVISTQDSSVLTNGMEIRRRIRVMETLALNKEFVFSATRPIKILAAAEKSGPVSPEFDASKLDSPEGEALLAALDPPEVARLQQPIHEFFEKTMIMADDPAVRAARLGLVKQVVNRLKEVGDFTKLVIED